MFLEDIDFGKRNKVNDIILRKNQVDHEVVTPTQVVDDLIHEEQTQNPQELVQQDQVALRRSTRVRRNTISDDYIVFLIEHETNPTISKDDPITFLQAMNCSMFNLNQQNKSISQC